MAGRKRTPAERFDLMEKAIGLAIEGKTGDEIVAKLKIGRSTLDKWRSGKDWADISRDVEQARRRESVAVWRGELKTAVKMVQRIAKDGDPSTAQYLDTVKYIVDSQELGPKEAGTNGSSENTGGQAPVAIQINTGGADTPAPDQLEAELRGRLGAGQADHDVDSTEE